MWSVYLAFNLLQPRGWVKLVDVEYEGKEACLAIMRFMDCGASGKGTCPIIMNIYGLRRIRKRGVFDHYGYLWFAPHQANGSLQIKMVIVGLRR